MKALIALMGTSKGRIATITTTESLSRTKKRKGYKEDAVVKKSVHNIIWGVAYDNKGKTIEARSNGDLPAENQGLNGMKWIVFPFVKQGIKSGKNVISVYPAKNGSKSRYWHNGTEINRERFEVVAVVSKSVSPVPTFNLSFDKIDTIKISGVTYRIENGDIVTA
jgi:hypothetical protein